MAKFRYEGQAPCRYGAGRINPGDIVDLPNPPNKNFKPIKGISERKPKVEKLAGKSAKEGSENVSQ
mgnify:CR=1 FL=1